MRESGRNFWQNTENEINSSPRKLIWVEHSDVGRVWPILGDPVQIVIVLDVVYHTHISTTGSWRLYLKKWDLNKQELFSYTLHSTINVRVHHLLHELKNIYFTVLYLLWVLMVCIKSSLKIGQYLPFALRKIFICSSIFHNTFEEEKTKGGLTFLFWICRILLLVAFY